MELALEPLNVAALDADEAESIRGGEFPWGPIVAKLVESFVENYDAAKQGFIDGLNGTYNPPSQR